MSLFAKNPLLQNPKQEKLFLKEAKTNNLMEFHQPGSIVETKPPKAQTKSNSSSNSSANRSQSKLLNESTRNTPQAATPPTLKKRVKTPTPKTNNFFDNEDLVSNSVNRSYSHENDEPLPSYSKTDTIRSDRSFRTKETPKSSRKLIERIEADEEANEEKEQQRSKGRKGKMQAFVDNEDDNQSLLKCIFTVDGRSADVEIDKYRIFWNYVAPSNETTTRKSSSKENIYNQTYEIPYDRIFSVEPKRVETTDSKAAGVIYEDMFSLSDEYDFEGFVIHVFERTKPNYYDHRSLTFLHPHRKTCRKWLKKLYKFVKAFQTERQLLVLLNPFSGEKRTRSVLNFIIYPLLQRANFKLDVIEFHDKQPLKDQLYERNINPNNYYGVLTVCGDGCISIIIRELLEKQIYDDTHSTDIDLRKHSLKTPLCFLPAGTTNMIASSIYGSSYIYTPLMYLIYGDCMNIDVASVNSSKNQFYFFGFGFACGYGANVVRYSNKYPRLGLKKVQAALVKAAAKKKKNFVEVEIQYIPSYTGNPCDKIRCFKNCPMCDTNHRSLNGVTSDEVQEFDPLAVSISEIEENLGDRYNRESHHHTADEWKKISGTFMHVELVTNAMLSDLACGGGLSKYTHLADGSMDLILVDKVPRKEFYRFLRRHTNRKNQLDFPFVKSIRIKEAKIMIKNQGTVSGTSQQVSSSILYDGKSNNMDDDRVSINTTKVDHFEKRTGHRAFANSYVNGSFVSHEFSDSDNDEDDDAASDKDGELSSDFEQENETAIRNSRLAKSRRNEDNSDNDENVSAVKRNATITKKHSILELPIRNGNPNSASAPKMYYIKKNENVMGSNANLSRNELDDTENDNASIMTRGGNRGSMSSLRKSRKFILEKSRSILDLFRSDEHKRSNSAAGSPSHTNEAKVNERKSKSSSKTEKMQRMDTFKSVFAWNVDWNLTSIPSAHIKCQKQYLTVFGGGVDLDTVYEDSIKSCFSKF